MKNKTKKTESLQSKGNSSKPLVSDSLPITDAEYKDLMKVLYPVDNSKKFRRQ